MLTQITLGCALMVATTCIHAGAMMLALRTLQITHWKRWTYRSHHTKALAVSGLVLIFFVAAVGEAALWAATYLAVGALSTFQEALYFSMVTFTTLGYGDLVLTGEWRLLASFEAANGTIMFGWTTAVIMAMVHRIYFQSAPLTAESSQ